MHYLCLVIQSDATSAHLTNAGLSAYGLKPYHVTSIESAVDVVGQWKFDVVMLDADGFESSVPEMLEALRDCQVPVVVSSSCSDEEDFQISQLEHGATSLVLKSASVRLTALRLRRLAELRRHGTNEVPTTLHLGPLVVDTRRSKASICDTPMDLSSRQFEILLLLTTRAEEFVHRQDIASAIRQGREESSRSIDMHISRIRRKLRIAGDGSISIRTVYGLGYCLTTSAAESGSGEAPLRWCA